MSDLFGILHGMRGDLTDVMNRVIAPEKANGPSQLINRAALEHFVAEETCKVNSRIANATQVGQSGDTKLKELWRETSNLTNQQLETLCERVTSLEQSQGVSEATARKLDQFVLKLKSNFEDFRYGFGGFSEFVKHGDYRAELKMLHVCIFSSFIFILYT